MAFCKAGLVTRLPPTMIFPSQEESISFSVIDESSMVDRQAQGFTYYDSFLRSYIVLIRDMLVNTKMSV